MGRQAHFYDLLMGADKVAPNMKLLRLLNWNIRNPSLLRAKEQAKWIINNNCNAIILTEVKRSEGCLFLANYLETHGYKIIFSDFTKSDYGVLLALQGFTTEPFDFPISFMPHRIPAVSILTPIGVLLLIGIYVPSRGPLERKNVDKRTFQNHCTQAINGLATTFTIPMIIAGDLNVIEPDHQPRYPVFGEWEYSYYRSFQSVGLIDAYRAVNAIQLDHSWFGRAGSGYRFDHIFVADCLMKRIINCWYDHACRESRLSDHSAMFIELSLGKVS